MMDYKEACDIALKANPDMEAILVTEYDDCFSVNLVPKNNDSFFANSCGYAIDKKTKKHGWASIDFFLDKEEIKINEL